jgi:DNA-binding CsgD family transcriptional regulator
VMLDTLRAYGARLQAEAGEQDAAAAALAGYALRVAEEAAAELQTAAGEEVAARRLDAEDPAMRQVLAWAMAGDAAVAVRLAGALGSWWWLRGRLTGQYPLLREIAARAEAGSEGWCATQCWLGWAALSAAELAGALGHFTAVLDAAGDQGDQAPSRVLADALAGRSSTLLNLGRLAEGTEDGRRSLAMARELGYPAGEGTALRILGIAAWYGGDYDGAVQLIRQQQLIAGLPASMARRGSPVMIHALVGAGDLAAAESACAAAVAQCRDAGDVSNLSSLLMVLADLDVQAGRSQDAAVHLREGLQAALRAGTWWDVLNGLWYCALLCTVTGRDADGATLWEAYALHARHHGLSDDTPGDVRRREESLSMARQALGPDRSRAAQERGAAMSLDTAAEYALMLTVPAPAPPAAASGSGLGGLSARERELVTLVARGHTDAQIAAQLYISVRTVGSHLDRIRDKTGCRRRADLTRLALSAGLI